MKHSSGPTRTTATLSESTHQRLNMYALAASAAGVGILALTPPAQARIIYTPTHRTIKTHQILHLDLNHDRIGDYLVSNRSFCTSDICGRTLRVLPVASKNRVVGAKGIRDFGRHFLSIVKGGSAEVRSKNPIKIEPSGVKVRL
jgi:hypothetical protein